jgi:heat shock protein HtpX
MNSLGVLTTVRNDGCLELSQEGTISYVINPEIPQSYMANLYEFIYRKFILPRKERYADISRTTLQKELSLAYTVVDSSGNKKLRIQATGDKPINFSITPLSETVSEEEISKAKEDIDIAIDLFEQQVRNNTLFFAWREGESIVPESTSGKQNKSLRRIFLETQILLMVAFMAIGLILFYFIGPFVPVVLLAIQFVFVFYSNKIIARSADWHITESNPVIHLLEYPLPLEDAASIRKVPRDQLINLKKEVYEKTISKNGELDCQAAHEIFSKYGIECKPENLMTRKVDVYHLVKGIADKFGFPMPEIVVSNTLLPNAAASGPSPSRGVVLTTTGLFVQLEDNEIQSVLGHEFGHLKGHDPLWLYGLSAVQYLFWFYVIFGLFPTGSLLLLFIYFWALAAVTYFVAKFFEARADLISAIVIGQPQVLADALEKIGFQRLLYERMPSFRIQEWLNMDPHPPIYFRIARLRKLEGITKINHPLIQSAREVTAGFIHSFS